ncbi:MAG: DUF504 domain-containing protein [Thermoproteota archaeon]|nr:DUF504 domain-containing protein [Thermoproteota archaeon]
MVKKGKIEEIFSKAIYADNPSHYIVTYRDFENFKQINLKDFVYLSEHFQLIPVTRIIKVQKGDKILYQKHLQ